jgi:prolyl-tRNA editing enzyme YbaK/EbsC (Cys-tRNA(Pro) deacylase)
MRDQVRTSYRISSVAMVSKAIGGVAPIAHATSIATYIDSALGEHEVVWAAAGHPHAVFPTTFAELVGITGAEVIEVAEG